MKSYTLIGPDGKPYKSAVPGTLGGHRGSKGYGRLDCPCALRWIARGYYVKHRVFFADEATAIAAGYRPCAICMKERYVVWKRARALADTRQRALAIYRMLLNATGGFPMISYKVLPLDENITHQIRTTLTDPIYGSAVQVSVAGPSGYGPCRSCLNTFREGERRILFLYNPFSREQAADFAGPVFIHDAHCERYSRSRVFPEPIKSLPITFKGYDVQKHFIAEEVPLGQDIETALARLFQRPEVAFIHVRNTEAKCFIMRIEREHETLS